MIRNTVFVAVFVALVVVCGVVGAIRPFHSGARPTVHLPAAADLGR